MSNPNVFVRAWDWWNNPKARGVEVPEEPGAGEPEFERGSTELAEWQKAQGAGRMTDLEATGDMPAATSGQDAAPTGPKGLSQATPRRGQDWGTDSPNVGGRRVDAWEGQGPDRITDLEATGDMPKASGGQDAPPSGPRGLSQAPARRGQTWGNDPENQVVLKGGGRGKTGEGGGLAQLPHVTRGGRRLRGPAGGAGHEGGPAIF